MRILVEILCIALVALAVARLAKEPWRGRGLNLLKAWVTVRAFWLLLMHPVAMEDGSRVVAWRLILETLERIDPATFWLFCAAAAAIKFVGILASMQRWIVLLRGQGIELPFRHVFGSFLIGRFIGTFLPSTAGLDGYTLYDAARFSGRTVEATAAKALEKVIGVTGIFLSFLVALPVGMGMFYSIFERDTAHLVAGLGTALCGGVIAGLMVVLWFPGLVQWGIEHLPIPGKARLEGIVVRISHSAAAYRDKKRLIVLALALSFVVHFTTAAMYYFTALAIGAVGAEFWPIVLASSIQILATVLSPVTIAGEGIRELAQLVLLQNMIGPAAAIVSAALGFWAAEALTLAGGVFWWIRPAGYTPAWCRVDGVQVDYAEAARAAVALETDEDRARRAARGAPDVGSWVARARSAAGYGFGAGVLAGLLVAVPESLVIAAGGLGAEAQVLWYGPLVHAALFGALGALGGVALAVLPMDRADVRGWTPSLAMLATLVPFGLFVTLFRLRRDVYAELMPPVPVLLGVLGGFALLALALFLAGPRLFRGRLGAVVRPLPALALAALVTLAGAVAGAVFGPSGAFRDRPPAVPAALAERPNVILVMVDTLRADHLSCYGGEYVETPHMCRLAADGTIYRGFSHASWTKPAAASLLTSLLPTSHGAMSKPSALGEGITTLAEAMGAAGYTTGGVVSNINLAESFGFHQGFDEYYYLGPDYLFGADESSSKLIFYQLARRVYFKFQRGLRFGDFYQDAQVVNEVAFDWLERHAQARFFLFLHYMDPHDPYFRHPYDGYGIARAANQDPPASQAEEMHELYVGEIAYLDEHFGALLARLEALGLYDDTVIALVSDHGEEFQEHGGWWHGTTLYEEQIHVPLLVKWPAGARPAPPDARGYVARLIDVAPTLLAQAGAEIPQPMQGVDLASGPEARSERDLYHFAEEDHEGNVLRAIRTERWKWIEANPGNPRGLPTEELFDVAADPGERRNLHPEASDAETVAELRAHLLGQQAFAESRKAAEGAATISKAEEDALRALGYIQ